MEEVNTILYYEIFDLKQMRWVFDDILTKSALFQYLVFIKYIERFLKQWILIQLLCDSWTKHIENFLTLQDSHSIFLLEHWIEIHKSKNVFFFLNKIFESQQCQL